MQQNTEEHYAIEQLKLCHLVLMQAIKEMTILRQKLKQLMDKDKLKAKKCYAAINRLRNITINGLKQAYLALLELNEDTLAKNALLLKGGLSGFNLMSQSYDKLCSVLLSFSNSLPLETTTNAALIGRLMNNVKMGHYPTDLSHVEMLAKALLFPQENTVNIVDPCCGTGAALKLIAEHGNCKSYGIELDEARAELALENLDRVGIGSFFHSRTSRNAFHLLFLNPPYMSVITSGARARAEKRFLVESYEMLMLGGVLMYVIPYYRLTEDIARLLCDNFTDIRLFKFEQAEFEKWRQIVVIGVRKKQGNGAEQVGPMLKSLAHISALPCLSQLENESYVLPDIPASVQVFKGAVFNEQELAQQLKQSKTLQALYSENELDNMQKQPLLPLSVGQVGLIGGSGLINGLAQCEHPHVIKGRIVKDIRIRTEVTKKDRMGNPIKSEQTETHVNKLIFNILTQQGFKSLT